MLQTDSRSLGLPSCDEVPEIPAAVADSLYLSLAFDGHALAESRAARLEHWRQRKRVLDPLWAGKFAGLPAHVAP
eukprot:7589087-Pyramimonas_sp.AAC.1